MFKRHTPMPDPTQTPAAPDAMAGQNIVCFARDWFETPTSNNHVMVALSQRNKVLWLNSVATRAPNLASGRDIKKIFRKLADFFAGAKQVRPNLWVYSPVVLPFPHSRWAAAVNRFILRTNLKILRRKLGMKDFQLWSFLPTVADYIGRLGESVSVYYCVDEWSKFSYVDGPKLAAAEERLCRKVDVVFATSASLVESRRPFNPSTFLARHGVDVELFRTALSDSTPIPPDLARLQPPILGFYGTIQDWVDLDLIAYLAKRHPDWSIALIGKTMTDLTPVQSLPNVHFLGKMPHDSLPMYCKGLAVGLIPQKVNELTVHMNPLKLREYLAAGLPVVCTALPEARGFSPWCVAADSYADFEQAVAAAIASDSPDLRRRRSESMNDESWQSKVDQTAAKVMQIKAQKCRKP
ncbi:MAG: glycosyltransferase [Tepidisphaeraceae bacterium]|jgi:glycosyltransferase involved in cell wall biosynthesis